MKLCPLKQTQQKLFLFVLLKGSINLDFIFQAFQGNFKLTFLSYETINLSDPKQNMRVKIARTCAVIICHDGTCFCDGCSYELT